MATRLSFLDRLKREADQQRAQAEAVARERETRENCYLNDIEPRMKALTSYLEGLVATLLEVKPNLRIHFPVPGYGDLGVEPYWDYQMGHERRHRSFLISMSWTLRVDPERSRVVRAEGPGKVKTLTSLFRQHHLGGIKEERRTQQGEVVTASFHARGFIKARMHAQISAEDPILRLAFDNASWLGSSRRQIPWDQIDERLFDRIARFIVREDDSLFAEELSEELRQRLRPDSAVAPVQSPPSKLPGAVLAEARGQVAVTPESPVSVAPPLEQSTDLTVPAPAVSAPVTEQTPQVEIPPAALVEPAPPKMIYTPSMIAAPPPPDAGESIAFDESKLDASAFMSRMSRTLARLRIDEDEDKA